MTGVGIVVKSDTYIQKKFNGYKDIQSHIGGLFQTYSPVKYKKYEPLDQIICVYVLESRFSKVRNHLAEWVIKKITHNGDDIKIHGNIFICAHNIRKEEHGLSPKNIETFERWMYEYNNNKI